MNFEWDQRPINQRIDTVEDLASRIGFPMSDIEALIDSELDTAHLLDYIAAVLSDRMN
jgi:hypothetical protein